MESESSVSSLQLGHPLSLRCTDSPNSRSLWLMMQAAAIYFHFDMRSLRVLTGDVHRECERGKERVEKFSLLPAGDKRRALTDILYHIFLHSFLFSFCAKLPWSCSLSLPLSTFFSFFFLIQVSVHLCSRHPIKKNWFPLNTHHLYAVCVCVSFYVNAYYI